MALPQVTDEQRKAALEKAKVARKKLSDTRKMLKEGTISVKEVLNTTDEVLLRMKVTSLIESLPGYGKRRAEALMKDIGIMPNRRIKGLGSKQKEALIQYLEDKG